jgi:hypothetical protein
MLGDRGENDLVAPILKFGHDSVVASALALPEEEAKSKFVAPAGEVTSCRVSHLQPWFPLILSVQVSSKASDSYVAC